MDAFTNQDGSSFQPGVVTIDLVFTAGTAGAVPSFSASNSNVKKGINTVTLSTNDYLVVFNDKYAAFLGGNGNVVQATPSKTTAFNVKCTAVNAGAGTATITPFTEDGNATSIHLSTGDILSFTFRFTRLAPSQVD